MLTGDRKLIRDTNIALVTDAIRRLGPISRVEIARQTGLGKSTITAITAALLREGIIEELGSGASAQGQGLLGRRPVLLDIRPGARFVVAVKLGPLGIQVALADLRGRLSQTEFHPLPPAARGQAVLEALFAAMEGHVAGHGLPWERILGIGVSLPGVVNVETGTSVSSFFLAWSHLPLRQALEERFGKPTYVDNDANALALAEYWHCVRSGAAPRCMLTLSLGVGIGAGIVLDGRVFRGAIGGAGEIGHIPIESGPEAPLCACGRRGCLEAFAADAAVARAAGQPTREQVVEAARSGDRRALAALEAAAERIGVALVAAVNLFNPDRIVIGGEAGQQAGELLLDPIRRYVAEHGFDGLTEDLQITASATGDQGWLLGAAAEVLDEVFRLPWGATPGARAGTSHTGAGGASRSPIQIGQLVEGAWEQTRRGT